MSDAEVERFLFDQKSKCEQLLTEAYIKKGEGTDIHQCPPIFDGLLCWSETDAPETATLPCPPASIMGYTDLISENLRAFVVASKICLPRNEWSLDSDDVFWSNYGLCVLNTTRHMINSTENNTRLYEIPENWTLFKWLPIIKIASQIGCVISLITLIVAMAVFSLLKKLKNPRNKLHMHLFVSFTIKIFMTFLKDWIFIDEFGIAWDVIFINGYSAVINERSMWICKALTSLWQYFNVTNYSWILMEGLYLYRLIFKTLYVDPSKITRYIILGWGLPILVLVLKIIIQTTIENTFCWSTNNSPLLFLIINIPIIISILYNFLLFLTIVLFVNLKTSAYLHWKKMKYKAWAKATMVLILLFGTHYILYVGLFFSQDYRVELVWFFCDQLFTSYQGALVVLLYCLLNSEVIEEMRRA
ncbi:parathyroid hormone 2 receptor-like isoform X2 [Nylanderia fulva]|uniref:parathyroid hormone 2 receptor-like isoform X2 n=1 Tax=Nylanderia fulva TaxID=613905 RepID=UPI0010FB67A4|nr:parathyroid hormone 2 receptor-like isoform X2 [Nylanderia fulva]